MDWHYDAKYMNILIPNYVHKQLIRYKPDPPRRPKYSPYEPKPIHYGKLSDEIVVEPDSPLLRQADKKYIQQVVGSFLYYARVVDRPVWFTLLVDDFGIKYTGQENAQHLIDALKDFYEVEIYWKGKLYCGIVLDWRYDAKYVKILMPNYVHKQLIRYKPDPPRRPQYSPYEPKPINYGKRSDEILVDPDRPLLGHADKK